MTRSAAPLAVLALVACAACSTNQQGAAAVTADAPAIPASTATTAPPAAAPTTSATPFTAPLPTASAAPPPPSAEPTTAPAPPAPEAALPAVKVSNIGMHIGGGPNDDVTKDPIRRSVQPHFDEFRRCFARVEDPSKTGDFGVDLRIDRAGGKAQVSHPRTALKGKDFKECVVHTFEEIDFLKPKGGTTTVSYSLRFTPT